MTHPGRRGRAGERGQGFWEWFVFGSAILAVGTVMTVAVGGWAAATYDQHHSNGPLTSSTGTSTSPSVAFVDFSPVGLYEDCILGVARGLGLTWDGGALGWSAASNPRPRGHVTDQDVQQWRDRMTALVGGAAGSADWKRCSQPQLPPALPRSPEPVQTVDVNGNYTIDPASVAGIGGCGADTGPRAMTVSGGGSNVTIFFVGSATAQDSFTGTISPSYSIDDSITDSGGTQHKLQGSFSSNAGATRFNGEYETLDNTAGCGYQFVAQKN